MAQWRVAVKLNSGDFGIPANKSSHERFLVLFFWAGEEGWDSQQDRKQKTDNPSRFAAFFLGWVCPLAYCFGPGMKLGVVCL